MRWNKPANRDRQALISAAMLQTGSDAGDVLDSLIRGLEMPRSLGAVKIGRDNFQRIAVQAMATSGYSAPEAYRRSRSGARDTGACHLGPAPEVDGAWHYKRPLHEYFGGYRGWILPPTSELVPSSSKQPMLIAECERSTHERVSKNKVGAMPLAQAFTRASGRQPITTASTLLPQKSCCRASRHVRTRQKIDSVSLMP